ncbi:MAG: hypothetical protein OIF32_01430 [Campylobacterales bacterium]|nr:hypothetical protein [Campylobacterales bacterium]
MKKFFLMVFLVTALFSSEKNEVTKGKGFYFGGSTLPMKGTGFTANENFYFTDINNNYFYKTLDMREVNVKVVASGFQAGYDDESANYIIEASFNKNRKLEGFVLFWGYKHNIVKTQQTALTLIPKVGYASVTAKYDTGFKTTSGEEVTLELVSRGVAFAADVRGEYKITKKWSIIGSVGYIATMLSKIKTESNLDDRGVSASTRNGALSDAKFEMGGGTAGVFAKYSW